MGKKEERLSAIRRIVNEEMIGSQEDLIARLSSRGIAVTQSTLSRDFKELNISKMPHGQGYIYVLSDQMSNIPYKGTSKIEDAVVSLTFSGNIGVLTTKAGYASAVSVIVDGYKLREILGTVAGDNVVIIVMNEGYDRNRMAEQFREIFPMLA